MKGKHASVEVVRKSCCKVRARIGLKAYKSNSEEPEETIPAHFELC